MSFFVRLSRFIALSILSSSGAVIRITLSHCLFPPVSKRMATSLIMYGKLSCSFTQFLKWSCTSGCTIAFNSFNFSVLLAIFKVPIFIAFYGFYFSLLFLSSLLFNKNLKIALYSLWATIIQFYGYGKGFLLSYYRILILKQKPQEAFPELFFKK